MRFLTLAFLVLLAAPSFHRARAQEAAPDPDNATAPAAESTPSVPAAGHSLHGETFDEGPRQAAVLLPGMGEVSFSISTQNPQAQQFFNQGVAQLHTFYYLEAERSFRQAARLDPAHPMPYWGMAMANVNNAKRAKGFLKEIDSRKRDDLSHRESLFINALKALYADDGNDKSRRQNYLLGLETIVQEYPDDLEARAFLILAAYSNGQKDGYTSRQAIEEMIVALEQRAPLHPAVHHYRIHLWDGAKPKLAERSAQRYELAAPGIAHAWHMPGHTYDGLKRYAEAARQQEGSARVDHASMTRDRIMPFEIHNYAHNNQWLATSLARVGRVRDAINVARNLVEQPRDPAKNHKNDGGSAQRSGRARWAETLSRFELWNDLIEATESGALDWSDLPVEQKDRAYYLGLAYAHLHNRAALAAQIEALRAIKPSPPDPAPKTETPKPDAPAAPSDSTPQPDPTPSIPTADPAAEQDKPADADAPAQASKPADSKSDDQPDAPNKSDDPKPEDTQQPNRRRARNVPGIDAALAELEGHHALIDGDHEAALKHFEKAGSMRPESRARVFLTLGRHDDAEKKAREAVSQNENQVAPLAACIEILHALGKDSDAQQQYEKLASLARHADPDLPALRRIEGIAALWRAEGWNPPAADPNPTALDDLSHLGPLCWSPYDAEEIALTDTDGATFTLSQHRGRNVVLLFFLGGKCAHCMQQLDLFGKQIDALAALDAELVAISTDDFEASCALKANPEGVSFPMPLLADPQLSRFRAYRCFDDFEDMPLHGTFLIDRNGKVRFQRISADPFLDIDFVKAELARINRLVPRASP